MPRRKAPDTQLASTTASGDLAQLWATEYGRFQASRSRIKQAGQWRRNEVTPRVPWADPGPFQIMLPHATTMGQSVAAFLARRRPSVHRDPLGSDPRAERIASRIENWLQPVLEDELQSNGEPLWDAALAFAVHDGEWASLVVPAADHWDELLDYTVDEGGVTVIAPRFQRDSKGRAVDDEFYAKPGRSFKLDKIQSAMSHADYSKDAKAPASCRSTCGSFPPRRAYPSASTRKPARSTRY